MFDRISHGISAASQLVNSIAISLNEQASGMEQLNQGVAAISQVVQNTAASAQESAAASEELSSQAEHLKERVGTFKLNKNISIHLDGDYSRTHVRSLSVPQSAIAPKY